MVKHAARMGRARRIYLTIAGCPKSPKSPACHPGGRRCAGTSAVGQLGRDERRAHRELRNGCVATREPVIPFAQPDSLTRVYRGFR